MTLSEIDHIDMPADGALLASQMTEFRGFCERHADQSFANPASFHDFSVQEFRKFWALFFEWSTIAFEGSLEPVCTDDRCEFAAFFPNVRLNYAENLLRIQSHEEGERAAITALSGSGVSARLSRRELRGRVCRLAAELHRLRVVPGDRIVAVVRNTAEAVIGGLAAAAAGATFSSATPEMGTQAILSRFQQLSPKILMAHLAARDGAGDERITQRIAEVAAGLPSVEVMIALDEGERPNAFCGAFVQLSELLARPAGSEETGPAAWSRYPYNHPLFILFSSGTTGKPKCIVHGAGGTLTEHVKEHMLHGDLRPGEKLFVQTSTAWMMWNWQLSALACGAEIILFDGVVTGPETLWRIVAEQNVSVFGTSPPYLKLSENSGYSPRQHLAFPALRAMMSTGSVLEDQQYDWVRRHVGDLPLQSISGGTDIIGCFVLGHPDLPVRRGESQCRSLGLDVGTLFPDATGIGELVCRNPFPSRPLGFYGDDDRSRFHAAYFSQNPGVWTHGDRVAFGETGGARLHGRSDSTMKVNGIRIGPAEIYRILHGLPQIQESMAVEQQTPNGPDASRMVLLVVPRQRGAIDNAVRMNIRKELAAQASSAHVPALIVEVEELPSTHSGKRSEIAVRDTLNGMIVANRSALSNPHCLEAIRSLVAAEDEHNVRAELPRDASIADKVRDIWERTLQVSDIEADDTFFELGGTSLMAVRMCQEINECLGVTVGPWILFNAPSLRMLTSTLDTPARMLSPVVPLRPRGRGHPLVLIPGMFGDTMELRALSNTIQCDRPLYGLRARGLAPGEVPHTRVEDIARDYLQHLRALQPRGPYSLVGYSFGGLVAFEIACMLRDANEDVEFLGLIDTDVHDGCLRWSERLAFWITRPLRYAGIIAENPMTSVPDLWRRFFRTRTFGFTQDRMDDAMSPLLQRVAQLNRRAFAQYRPRSYPGPMTIFRATKRWPRFCDPLPVWKRVTTGHASICEIQGGHTELVQESGVTALARRISALIEETHRQDVLAG